MKTTMDHELICNKELLHCKNNNVIGRKIMFEIDILDSQILRPYGFCTWFGPKHIWPILT